MKVAKEISAEHRNAMWGRSGENLSCRDVTPSFVRDKLSCFAFNDCWTQYTISCERTIYS